MPTVKIITLGCAKNDVDSEEIAGVLTGAGFAIDPTAKAPDITIINTCGFLEAAKLESIEVIKKSVRSRGKGKVIVAGCLTQRMGDQLQAVAPGAQAYVGVGQMGRFDQLVKQVLNSAEQMSEITPPQHLWAGVTSRARSGNPWSAYLKISEGCDHNCTFCTIPSFRGRHVSKPLERVLEEANHLVNQGALELNLIAQDVTQYGYDLYQEFTLPKLLRELNAIPNLRWIRLLYFYPNRLTDEVIETMATQEKVLPYIDIPLQHTHPDTLRRMKRPWDGERYLKVFQKVRNAMPHCAIRTTFIVGFPGETDQEFNHMVEFVNEAKLDRVGAFLYSAESGTPSSEMPGQVPHKTKKLRYERLMKAQQGISLAINQRYIGQPLEILVEQQRGEWAVGRSFRDAPEIDGLVFIKGQHEPGTLVTQVITDAAEYDLYGGGSAIKQLRTLKQAR